MPKRHSVALPVDVEADHDIGRRNPPIMVGSGPRLVLPCLGIGAPTALPVIAAGRVRALGISTPQRSALLPDLPTIAEAGLPGYGAYSWGGLSVRAGTPPEAVARLSAETQRVLREPEVDRRLLQIGAEPQPGSPAAFAAMLRGEIAKWAAVVRQANIRMD
jgi:tripartite-type tricarboxylate transporter receptor subunit TctC